MPGGMSTSVKALLASLALLLLLAAPASARLRIVAPVTVEGAQPVPFAATASQPAEEVAFYVDGHRRYVDHSPSWKFGRNGRVPLGIGRHQLKVEAHDGGQVTATTRNLYVEPTATGTHAAPATEETEETPAASRPTHPTYSDPNLLFDGQKIEDFGLIQAAPGAISEVPDPTGSGRQVLQFTVHDDDVYPVTPTENPRAQALSPGLINPGDEFWLETKFLLPTDLPEIPSWFGLCSVYGAPFDGPSPWSLEIDENEFRWQRNGTYDWDIPWRAPLIKGRWVTILSHERFGSEGFIEMWVNGQQIDFFEPGNYNPNHHPQTTRLEMQTMDASNYAAPNAAKITQYRKVGMFETATDYFDQLKLGTTRASVEG